MELVIGCVGKPSAGKSTFFNAVTDGKAKVGNFPFTTIAPNEGITYYMTPCPCVAKNKTAVCAPRYGKCARGTRYLPIKLLDVAGLIPGASEGAGLGNQFLDDLRHAHVLLHIIDVSGLTNEKGEATTGYNPIQDADWFRHELQQWVFTNLWHRWPTIARRHRATKRSLHETFLRQFSGYQATASVVAQVVERLRAKEPVDLVTWTHADVLALVTLFLDVRFPTVLVLNKADRGAATDRHIDALVAKYGSDQCVVASAAAEYCLVQAAKQGYIRYEPGAMGYTTVQDDEHDALARQRPLKALAPPLQKRLDRIADLVLFRFGGTGVRAAINRAVALADLVVVYPVASLTSFATSTTPSAQDKGIFADAVLVKRGTTIKDVAARVLSSPLAYAEGEDGRKRAEDERLTTSPVILKFTTRTVPPSETTATSVKERKRGSKIVSRGDANAKT